MQRYIVGDLLGRGGMAEVFASQSHGAHGFQKPVAIKRLLPQLAKDAAFVERLITEAKMLVGLQHSNLVSVLDLVREGNDVSIVMDLVDGPSLRQLMKARAGRNLSLGVSTYIVESAANGLAFAHGRPGGAIIHADVSPSNLLLTSSGEVRVADFGVARREGGGAGPVQGKWAYMAPEQVRGEPLTPRCDVFSLGVVLYELITGEHPLGACVTIDERKTAPLNIVPPRELDPRIPVKLDALCMRALAADPDDRFARMQDMQDALIEQRFANGWREGASGLAQAIREVPGVCDVQATQHTGHPVSIASRSLITAVTRVIVRSGDTPTAWRAKAPVADAPATRSLRGPRDFDAMPTTRLACGSAVAPLPPEPPTTPRARTSPVAPPIVPPTPPPLPPAPPIVPPPAPRALPVVAPVAAPIVAARGWLGRRAVWLALGCAALAIGTGAGLAFTTSDEPEVVPAIIARPPTPVVAAEVVAPPPDEPAADEPPTEEPAVEVEPAAEPEITIDEPPPVAPPPVAPIVRPRRSVPVAAPAITAAGVLRVETDDGLARVTLGSERKEAPGARFERPAGTYTVVLADDTGAKHRCTVDVVGRRTRTLTVSMQTGACRLR